MRSVGKGAIPESSNAKLANGRENQFGYVDRVEGASVKQDEKIRS
jgi:hypothetical protein